MGLNFDLTRIKNREQVCSITTEAGTRMNPVTEALIFATMFTGIGPVITAELAPEFYARIQIFELIKGAIVHNQDGPMPITLDDVTAHIGLKTNVFEVEDRAAWLERQFVNRHPAAGPWDPAKHHNTDYCTDEDCTICPEPIRTYGGEGW
ncbi:hypothetical protein [Kribbella deserti]|uniref:Uncharacterized protein n=1 Tax=Kribbella deserti TaxID=1926257 RepID=A0ABV6QDY8_9ACTN